MPEDANESAEPEKRERAEEEPRDRGGGAGSGEESAGEQVRRLERELGEKVAEAERNAEQYLRALADIENLKKRTRKEKAEALRFAGEGLVRDLLPVVDNLERAVEHAESGGDGQPLLEGVKLVLRSALDALEKHGIRRIDAGGAPFDPAVHEAIARVPDPSREPNRVIEQFQPGYRLHERLLRPAKVSVSVRPQAEESRGEPGDGAPEKARVEKRRNDG